MSELIEDKEIILEWQYLTIPKLRGFIFKAYQDSYRKLIMEEFYTEIDELEAQFKINQKLEKMSRHNI